MKPINVKHLEQYSMSEDGRVFKGEREILHIQLGKNKTFALIPDNRDFPESFTIEHLYKATFGKKPAKELTMKAKDVFVYTEIILTDTNKEKINFPNPEYACTFLKVTEEKLGRAIKNKTKIKGFKVVGLSAPAFNGYGRTVLGTF